MEEHTNFVFRQIEGTEWAVRVRNFPASRLESDPARKSVYASPAADYALGEGCTGRTDRILALEL